MAKILHVDDEAEVLENVSLYLVEVSKHEVISHNNIQDGYNAFLEHEPDVVITDRQIPKDNDGYEFLEQIREANKKKYQEEPDKPQTKVIMLSGSAEKHHEEKAYALGVDAFIHKPTDMDELSQTINSLL